MHTVHTPRLMVAAASSGSGKTLLTCGLLDALSRRKPALRAYKCGPDYIDPMFHRQVLGIESGNLDPFFCDAEDLKRILGDGRGAYSVMEGVMGIYDGMSVESIQGSCYDIAGMTDTPILLVADASGVGRTIIPQIRGILEDDRSRLIRGLILNRISPSFYEKLKPCLEKALTEAGYGDVQLLGAIPKLRGAVLESRHLGLKMPSEIPGIREKLRRLGEAVEEHCDLEGILQIMEHAGDITVSDRPGPAEGSLPPIEERPLIAVARDEAFCFLYKENLRLLEQAGARIAFFSPLHDRTIPEDTAGLLLGGGYPELHLRDLSANLSMLDSIRCAVRSGLPSIAECGGFMYLHRSVRDIHGAEYPLVGVIDGECTDTGHLVRFGYLQITRDAHASNCAFGADLAGLRGHEFHYYESTACGSSCLVEKPVSRQRWSCMFCGSRRMWGYPHFYYGSHPAWLQGFVRAAKEYGNETLGKVFCK